MPISPNSRDRLQVQAARRAEYDDAERERDKIADELEELSRRLLHRWSRCLLARLRDSDARVDRVNQRLPNGTPRLLSAELVARKLAGFQDGLNSVPRIANEVRLPRFEYSAHDRY